MKNAELIKALRCKECFDLCNVESCRYHITNTKSGCKCAIKLMATDAAATLEAAEKRIVELEAAQRKIQYKSLTTMCKRKRWRAQAGEGGQNEEGGKNNG
jgi:hypothetical protein